MGKRYITRTMLVKKRACDSAFYKFMECFPSGKAEICQETIDKYENFFPYSNWAADRFLTKENRDKYYLQCNKAMKEYNFRFRKGYKAYRNRKWKIFMDLYMSQPAKGKK